jgi:phosphoribosylformylglycinamidine cyclo-ligase
VDSVVDELGGTLGAALLVPHRSYLPLVRPLLRSRVIKGMAHITGGGITENLPRIVPEGLHAAIDRSRWTVPAVFRWLQRTGGIPDAEMLRAFNMGIGLILAAAPEDAAGVLGALAAAGESGAVIIGEIRKGASGVVYEPDPAPNHYEAASW